MAVPTPFFLIGQPLVHEGKRWYIYSATIHTDRYRVDQDQQQWLVTYHLSSQPPHTPYNPQSPEVWVGPLDEDTLLAESSVTQKGA